MAISRFSQRVIGLVGLGVAVPAVLLASLGVYLSLRISDAIRAQSQRYNLYVAQQVAASFEQDLLASLQSLVAPAELAARNGQGQDVILAALGSGADEMGPAHFVPLEDLTGFDLLLVEHQPLVFARGVAGHSGRWF